MMSGLSHSISGEQLVAELKQSEKFKEYDEAFTLATGLPLAITPMEKVHFALCSKHNGGNPFCTIMSQAGHRCETCQKLNQNIESEMGISDDLRFSAEDKCEMGLTPKTPEVVNQISREFGTQPRTFECFAGLCETLVPIVVGAQIVAFLQTGQVLVHKPTKSEFKRAIEKLKELGENENIDDLEKAYFETPVLASTQYSGMVRLLKSFAEHLSEISNRILISQRTSEPEMISKAKAYISENYELSLNLEDVSLEVGASTFHFSKEFKKATGFNFPEYLSRVRVEKAKELLNHKNMRIAEIAFTVGFQSLAPFNRAFKRYEGVTPKQYREHEHSANPSIE